MPENTVPTTDDSGEGQPQQEQNPPAGAGVTPSEPPAADEAGVNPDAKRVDQLPTWAQKLIKDTRAEAADWRSKLKDAQKTADEATAKQGPSPEEITEKVKTDFAQQIAKALGLAAEEETPIDPQKVIETLTAERDTTAKERDSERERHRRALIELAVHRASQKVGADPDALLDSRSFLKAVRDMDPDADDFSTSLTETIQTAVENNPKFKAATQAGPPARSGASSPAGLVSERRVPSPPLTSSAPGVRSAPRPSR
ncbi:hypothetical protein ACFQQB_51240 [Nonomuraea rubra]|uniref:hypothetical protein n=1 Tax=Nonomuraea rubra TaxID=46180 RepID=UPI003616DFDC